MQNCEQSQPASGLAFEAYILAATNNSQPTRPVSVRATASARDSCRNEMWAAAAPTADENGQPLEGRGSRPEWPKSLPNQIKQALGEPPSRRGSKGMRQGEEPHLPAPSIDPTKGVASPRGGRR